ncbi:MAG: DUF1624 domain-containing protein [Beijerinckiaceae bacterium]
MNASPDATTVTGKPARWLLLDVMRGIAVVAMIIYHFTWDLSFFRYISADVATSPGWSLFAKSIAASFLFLAGVSFALATRHGFDRIGFRKRLIMIAVAALAVSIGTAYAMPHAPVFFGILHCIAASSLLLLPFRQRPAWMALGAAGLIFIAPILFASAAFDGKGLAWLGLNVTPLSTVDHVPLLPWSGWALLGFGLMRLFLTSPASAHWAAWQPRSLLPRGLIFSGRHSLAIYLIHQPLLMGLLSLAAPVHDGAGGFADSCRRSCARESSDTLYCVRYCNCMQTELQARPLWPNVLRNALTPDQLREAAALAAQCQRSP